MPIHSTMYRCVHFFYSFHTRHNLNYTGLPHYDDVIMGTIASQITSLTIVYSTAYLGADQSKHQSSASLAFVWGIHRGPMNSPHKWPVTRKMFPFDDVIMSYRVLMKMSKWGLWSKYTTRVLPDDPMRWYHNIMIANGIRFIVQMVKQFLWFITLPLKRKIFYMNGNIPYPEPVVFQWQSSGNPVCLELRPQCTLECHWIKNFGSQCASSGLPVAFQWSSSVQLCKLTLDRHWDTTGC